MKIQSNLKKGLTIVAKVSILTATVTAFASLIVGTLIVDGSTEIIRENALNLLKYETNYKSLKLISGIKNLSHDAHYLASTPPIKAIARAFENSGIDPFDNSTIAVLQSRLSVIFTELLRAKPNYLQIRYIGINDDGREITRVNRNGRLITTTRKNKLQQKGSTDYFKKAILVKPGEIYLSNITLNRDFGEITKPRTPVLRASTPVYFMDKLFAIIVINMDFSKVFSDIIRNTPNNFIPYVTNYEGYFLVHPDPSMTFGFEFNIEYKIQNYYTHFNLTKNRSSRDTEFIIESDGDVIQVVKSFYDPTHKDRFFAVMLAISDSKLYSKSTQLKYKSFKIIGILVFISLIVAALLVSRLLRPLQLISIAANDLANGRDVSNLPINSGNEIGELARSFDNMRYQLEDKEQELIVTQGHVHHVNKLAALGEMAASVAHEINSPIQAISLMAQRIQRQLKKNISQQDIHDSMSKITQNVIKISHIIDSLRKVSRNSTGDEFKESPISDLIEDVINMTDERFKINDVQFDVNYHDISKNTLIQCQYLQIGQVLINLVNNAYDAIYNMGNKWIKVDIRKIVDVIQISITDSGPGIPQAIAERIFEPMYTTKDIGKGTGLGLSISNDIVLKHNGKFYINKESPNTCFVVELPVRHKK